MSIKTMTREEVAKDLRTAPPMVTAAIKNGTMPIGMVAKIESSSRERTIVIRERYEKWLRGEL